MSLDLPYEAVREFHFAFAHPVGERPTPLGAPRAALRAKWMTEEIHEFLESNTIEDQADAMIDLIYFALGALVEMGVRPHELFQIVHAANMSKLWPDGQPKFNPEGKVIKPPGWKDPGPALHAAIQKQASDTI